MDFMQPSSVLDLNNIRAALIRMEDTILFDLIERAQFYRSGNVYKSDAFESLNQMSFLEWMLRNTENMHSKLRRYESPDEVPFYPDELAQPVLPSNHYPKSLAGYHREINVNNTILEYYVDKIIPDIAAGEREQSENYGSCTLTDIQALQAISRRIHFGKFVAEAKFQMEKERVLPLIKSRDEEGIMELITNSQVEQKVLERVREKAEKYTVDPQTNLRWSTKTQGKVDPSVVVGIYKNCVIPLTKRVEVDYLLRRLEDDFEIEL